MSLAQKISVFFTNTAGTQSRAGAVAVVNKGGSKSVATITRPTNVTPYLAGAVVGVSNTVAPSNASSGILTFAAVGPAGGAIRLNSADYRIDVAAVPVGMAGFTLHLYDDVPDAVFDGAVWDLASANDRLAYLGFITFPAHSDLGSTLFTQVDGINKQLMLKDSSTTLYGVLVTTGAYTPSSGSVHTVRLNTQEI